MTGRTQLPAPVNCGLMSIDDHIRCTERFQLGERIFKYDLSEKATKAKLLKGSKRTPFLIEENSSSSNFVFCVGSWHSVVLPSVGYWTEIEGDQKCQVGDYSIRIGGTKTGRESRWKCVDT